jgi:hypothetical protein
LATVLGVLAKVSRGTMTMVDAGDDGTGSRGRGIFIGGSLVHVVSPLKAME